MKWGQETKKLRVKSMKELILWTLKSPRIMTGVVLAMIQRETFSKNEVGDLRVGRRLQQAGAVGI